MPFGELDCLVSNSFFFQLTALFSRGRLIAWSCTSMSLQNNFLLWATWQEGHMGGIFVQFFNVCPCMRHPVQHPSFISSSQFIRFCACVFLQSLLALISCHAGQSEVLCSLMFVWNMQKHWRRIDGGKGVVSFSDSMLWGGWEVWKTEGDDGSGTSVLYTPWFGE